MSQVAVIDYGMGNLKSVHNALEHLGAEGVTVSAPEDVLSAERLILPGVGAFGAAMNELCLRGLDSAIGQYIRSGRPFLGICLGQQLLFSRSEESPGISGLDCFPGYVARLCAPGRKIPEVGWNSLDFVGDSPLFRGVDSGCYVYFTHSFCVHADDAGQVISRTEYGGEFDSAVQNGNAFAVQFHPEKSGDVGLVMLKNFLDLSY